MYGEILIQTIRGLGLDLDRTDRISTMQLLDRKPK